MRPADIDINKLPKRRTDGSRIADIEKHAVKLYTTDGGSKLIKRWAMSCVGGHAACMKGMRGGARNVCPCMHDGSSSCMHRSDGRIERQYRLNVGKLPVAYK
jgi:hypothetical protein